MGLSSDCAPLPLLVNVSEQLSDPLKDWASCTALAPAPGPILPKAYAAVLLTSASCEHKNPCYCWRTDRKQHVSRKSPV